MIAFNRDYKPNRKDLNKNIQKILDIIYKNENFDNDYLGEGYLDESTNLAEITDLIYKKLFIDNNSSINLSIYKNPNNSLDVIVEKLD